MCSWVRLEEHHVSGGSHRQVQMSGTTVSLQEGSRVAGDTEQVPVGRMKPVRLASCP